jgi:hypothetical protein
MTLDFHLNFTPPPAAQTPDVTVCKLKYLKTSRFYICTAENNFLSYYLSMSGESQLLALCNRESLTSVRIYKWKVLYQNVFNCGKFYVDSAYNSGKI